MSIENIGQIKKSISALGPIESPKMNLLKLNITLDDITKTK